MARPDSLQEAMDRLQETLDAARAVASRHESERKVAVRARMEAGEPIDVGRAVWATDGKCLTDEWWGS